MLTFSLRSHVCPDKVPVAHGWQFSTPHYLTTIQTLSTSPEFIDSSAGGRSTYLCSPFLSLSLLHYINTLIYFPIDQLSILFLSILKWPHRNVNFVTDLQ